MDRRRAIDLWLCALFGLAAAAVNLLPLALVPTLAIPILMYLAGSLRGYLGAALSTLCCFLLSMLIFGQDAIPVVVYAGVVAFGAAVVISMSKKPFEALVGASGVTMLGIWSNILVSSYMFGSQVIDNMFVADETVLALARQSYALMGYTEREVAALVGEFSSMYGEMVPAVMLGFAMLAGLIAFLLASALTKGRRQYKVPPFSQWAMPKGSMLGALIMLLVGYAGEALNWPGFSSVLLASQIFIMIAYSIQGLAVVWFVLGRTRLPLSARLPIAVLTLFFIGTGLLFVAVIDYALGFRKRLPPGGNGQAGPQNRGGPPSPPDGGGPPPGPPAV